MSLLGILFGALVGLSLGLTGGGGAIFAVPLLVFGLQVPPRDAVGISLAAVGATSAVGFLKSLRNGQVELTTGLLFAIAGMLGAPVGSRIAGLLSDTQLMTAFGGLMVLIAVRMWRSAQAQLHPAVACPVDTHKDGPTCRRDAQGRLLLNSRCAVLLLCAGLGTGVLSGLFGVGGGFVIVPALVLFSGISMQRAISTSLMVISFVSAAGVTSHLWEGRSIPIALTLWFVLGGVLGLLIGQRLALRLSTARLQQVFSVAILGVAILVISRRFLG